MTALLSLVSSLVVGGCVPDRIFGAADGPDVRLTAAEPVAEFEIVLCVDRPRRSSVSTWGSVRAEVEVTGDRSGVVSGRVVGEDADELRDALNLDVDGLLSFALEDELLGEAGPRCAAPQGVRFEYEAAGPPAGDSPAEVRLVWTASAGGEHSGDGLRADGPSDEDLSIEITPVEP